MWYLQPSAVLKNISSNLSISYRTYHTPLLASHRVFFLFVSHKREKRNCGPRKKVQKEKKEYHHGYTWTMLYLTIAKSVCVCMWFELHFDPDFSIWTEKNGFHSCFHLSNHLTRTSLSTVRSRLLASKEWKWKKPRLICLLHIRILCCKCCCVCVCVIYFVAEKNSTYTWQREAFMYYPGVCCCRSCLIKRPLLHKSVCKNLNKPTSVWFCLFNIAFAHPKKNLTLVSQFSLTWLHFFLFFFAHTILESLSFSFVHWKEWRAIKKIQPFTHSIYFCCCANMQKDEKERKKRERCSSNTRS